MSVSPSSGVAAARVPQSLPSTPPSYKTKYSNTTAKTIATVAAFFGTITYIFGYTVLFTLSLSAFAISAIWIIATEPSSNNHIEQAKSWAAHRRAPNTPVRPTVAPASTVIGPATANVASSPAFMQAQRVGATSPISALFDEAPSDETASIDSGNSSPPRAAAQTTSTIASGSDSDEDTSMEDIDPIQTKRQARRQDSTGGSSSFMAPAPSEPIHRDQRAIPPHLAPRYNSFGVPLPYGYTNDERVRVERRLQLSSDGQLPTRVTRTSGVRTSYDTLGNIGERLPAGRRLPVSSDGRVAIGAIGTGGMRTAYDTLGASIPDLR